MQPITEQMNPRTENIDVASPTDIVKILRDCDTEIFKGWNGSKGLYDGDVMKTIESVSQKAAGILKEPENGVIVMAGCGTSGRQAFMTVRFFNDQMKSNGLFPCYEYLIAGHDIALMTSVEAPEDDPVVGKQVLEQVAAGKQKVLYIGITCGLSAAYVAGQLDYCMDHLDVCIPVLLGFNPVHLARNLPIETWDKTFLTVAQRLESVSASGNGYILTPIIGPEPITGSSRMKGGSATKILLETIFTAAHQMTINPTRSPCDTRSLLSTYELVNEAVYYNGVENLGCCIEMAGHSLKSGGHIYYITFDRLGTVCLIDASECPPTYGANFDDVRAFIAGGYETLGNKEGDLSNLVEISLASFADNIEPKLTKHDLLVFLCCDGLMKVGPWTQKTAAKKIIFNFIVDKNKQWSSAVQSGSAWHWSIELPWSLLCQQAGAHTVDFSAQLYVEIAAKWVCNALTTGAHILCGKVYQNIMVDVKVSNNKLFHRAVGIIQRYAGCSREESQESLLRSIYRTDELLPDQRHGLISVHILKASEMDRVVPVALVMAIQKCSLLEAHSALVAAPVIRSALLACLQRSKSTQGPHQKCMNSEVTQTLVG